MKLSYVLLLSMSAAVQAIAAQVPGADTQSLPAIAEIEDISAVKRYLPDLKRAIESDAIHAVDASIGADVEIEARASKKKVKAKKPAKTTPTKSKPAKGKPAKGKPAKGKPAKGKPAKPKPTPKPKEKTPPKGKLGKCTRQAKVDTAGGKGKPAPKGKGSGGKAKPGGKGKGKAVKRTYTDFLKPRNAHPTAMAFQTVAARA